jgi:hypothetical protein
MLSQVIDVCLLVLCIKFHYYLLVHVYIYICIYLYSCGGFERVRSSFIPYPINPSLYPLPIYIHICIYIHIYIHIYIYIHALMNVYLHTAAVAVRELGLPSSRTVILATAHPAKFEEVCVYMSVLIHIYMYI